MAELSRRDFLKWAGVTAATAALSQIPGSKPPNPNKQPNIFQDTDKKKKDSVLVPNPEQKSNSDFLRVQDLLGNKVGTGTLNQFGEHNDEYDPYIVDKGLPLFFVTSQGTNLIGPGKTREQKGEYFYWKGAKGDLETGNDQIIQQEGGVTVVEGDTIPGFGANFMAALRYEFNPGNQDCIWVSFDNASATYDKSGVVNGGYFPDTVELVITLQDNTKITGSMTKKDDIHQLGGIDYGLLLLGKNSPKPDKKYSNTIDVPDFDKINTVVLEKVRSEFGDTVHVFADLQDIEDRDMMLDESQADPGILEVGEYLDRAIASNNILLDIGVRYPKGNDSIREYVLSL